MENPNKLSIHRYEAEIWQADLLCHRAAFKNALCYSWRILRIA